MLLVVEFAAWVYFAIVVLGVIFFTMWLVDRWFERRQEAVAAKDAGQREPHRQA